MFATAVCVLFLTTIIVIVTVFIIIIIIIIIVIIIIIIKRVNKFLKVWVPMTPLRIILYKIR